MNYFDPARPRFSNGARAILDPADTQGLYQGPLPYLMVEPEPDGTWSIEVQIRTSYNGYGMRFINGLPTESLISFMINWREDPEKVLREEFKWTPAEGKPQESKGAATSTTTLEDLGL